VEYQVLALEESDDKRGRVAQPTGNIPDEQHTGGSRKTALEDERAHVEVERQQDSPLISRNRQDVVVG
jgi:hypothetical protein